MPSHGYKKYMKKDVRQGNPLVKIFIVSFFGMLIVFTYLIKSFSPTVDTSIGDYNEQANTELETKKLIDNDSLAMIQDEDQGKNFDDLMSKAEDVTREIVRTDVMPQKADASKLSPSTSVQKEQNEQSVKQQTSQNISAANANPADVVYKVYVGTYTTSDQAKVAKEIIQDSGSGLTPIVKCLGANNYTLQVGTFKSKQSAESMLYTVQQNHLPGRVVQEY